MEIGRTQNNQIEKRKVEENLKFIIKRNLRFKLKIQESNISLFYEKRKSFYNYRGIIIINFIYLNNKISYYRNIIK